LASIVTSASSAKAMRRRRADRNRANASGANKLGVPPPKKTLSTRPPVINGSSVSKSRNNASMYAASGRADFN
jgi:hypothetical protein